VTPRLPTVTCALERRAYETPSDWHPVASPPVLETTLTVLLILGALTSVAAGVLYWRAAHSVEVRRVVVALRETLETVVANGGLEEPAFLEPDQQRLELELEDLMGRLNDRKLRARCQGVLDGYRRVWALAPAALWRPPEGNPVAPSNVNPDQRRDEQFARQVDDALPTIDAIRGVLDRINSLERFLPRRG
jgi:hypothetical protein